MNDIVGNLNPNPRALLQTHIDALSAKFGWADFNAVRRKHGGVQDPGTPPAQLNYENWKLVEAYQQELHEMARKVRIEAFDLMVNDLAAALGSSAPEHLLAKIKAAGIKIIDDDVHVVDWPLSIVPPVFDDEAWRLYY